MRKRSVRAWNHLQNVRAKRARPYEDFPDLDGFSRMRKNVPIAPRYRFLLRFASKNPAEVDFYLRNAASTMWRWTKGLLSDRKINVNNEKVFKAVVQQHTLVMKTMARWAMLDDSIADRKLYHGLTPNQISRKYETLSKKRFELQRKIYDIFHTTPLSLKKLLGKEADEFWNHLRHTVYVPDYDSVYRWMDSYRRE